MKWCRQVFLAYKFSTSRADFEEYAISIKQNLSAREMQITEKCDAFQLISKCLKSDKKSSHPERELGMGDGSFVVSTEDLSSVILSVVVESIEAAIKSIFHSHYPESYCLYYFFYSMCADVLKHLDVRSITGNIELLLMISKSLVLFLGYDEPQDASISVVYLKILIVCDLTFKYCCDVFASSASAEVVDIVEVLVTVLVALQVRISKLVERSSLDDDGAGCGFVDLESYIKTLSCSFLVSVATNCNMLLKESNTFFKLSMNLFEVILISCGGYHCKPAIFASFALALTGLAENDQLMLRFLVAMTEIQLRLELALGFDGLESSSCRQCDNETFVVSCREKLTAISRCGADITVLFIILLHAIHFDANVMVDLLCGTETSSLEYFLRLTKRLQVISPAIFLASCEKAADYMLIRNSMARSSSRCDMVGDDSSRRKVVVWTSQTLESCPIRKRRKVMVEGRFKDDDSTLSVAPSEWLWPPDAPPTMRLRDGEGKQTAPSDVISAALRFFEDTNKLLRKLKKSILPFDPSLLCKRIDVILNKNQRI